MKLINIILFGLVVVNASIADATSDEEFHHARNCTHIAFLLTHCDKDVLPRNTKLSWRVALIRYTLPDLYAKFNQNETWDSPHNIKLLKSIPDFLQDPTGKPGYTCYLGVSGEDCAFGAGGRRSLEKGKDGLRAPAAVFVSIKSIPWTKPEDLSLSEVKGIANLRWIEDRVKYICTDGSQSEWIINNPITKPKFKVEKKQ